MANSLWNIRTRPTVCNVLKVLRGHSLSMHWCYKTVDSTLIRHFSFAFGLGRSANPSGSFHCYVVDSSFYATPVLRAHFLHCVGVSKLVVDGFKVIEYLGFSPFGTHRRPCHCVVRYLDLILSMPSLMTGILHSSELILLGDKGRVYASSARGYLANFGGYTSVKLCGKLQVVLSFPFFISRNRLAIK